MNVTVVLDHKFLLDSGGKVCAQTMFGDSFWESYFTAFESIDVICRVRPIVNDELAVPISSDRIRFHPVPFYEGPVEFLKRISQIKRQIASNLASPNAIILRVPQILPTFAAAIIGRQVRPYGVEVVGDPWDVYAPGAEASVFRPFFRHYFSRRLRKICWNATASCYVTQYGLQRRYPPNPQEFSTYASDVQIDRVVDSSRSLESFSDCPMRLLFVGALNRLYKGQDILLQSVAQCVSDGLDIALVIVGDGQYRQHLERLADELNLSSRVRFAGSLPFGPPVFDEMDRADLFVLPSRQEGLARTVPEAMSRGLPCVSSDVGGMAEIVPAECLVVPGDVESLSSRIKELYGNREKLSELSKSSLNTARRFLRSETEPRREEFMRALLSSTAKYYEQKTL